MPQDVTFLAVQTCRAHRLGSRRPLPQNTIIAVCATLDTAKQYIRDFAAEGSRDRNSEDHVVQYPMSQHIFENELLEDGVVRFSRVSDRNGLVQTRNGLLILQLEYD